MHIKTMKRSLLALAVLAPLCCHGQSFHNALHYGSATYDEGYSVCTDAGGNVYMTGSYGDSVTIGATVLRATGIDGFVVKYNSSLDVQWVKRVTGAGTQRGFAVKADNAGNVYVAGEYVDTAVVDGVGLADLGGNDIFLLKMNAATGAPVWLKGWAAQRPAMTMWAA
jgi:hypothetical protein